MTDTTHTSVSDGRALTALDQRLLTEMQADFPLAVAPFRVLGERLGASEGGIVARVTALRAAGLLRHVAPIFDAEALGYSTCLVAMRVPDERLASAAEAVNAHPGVSHNYRRTHAFNMWFTIAVPPGSELQRHVDALHALAGAESTRLLPATRRYKIGVSLDVTGERAMDERSQPRHTGGVETGTAKRTPTPREIEIILTVQGDVSIEAHPFAAPARKLGMEGGELVEALADLQRQGYLRRFAGILRHREAGFAANGMAVWNVPDEDVRAVGEAMATYTAISHCYERPRYDDWPYNLFTMIHARSTTECEAFVAQLAETHGTRDYALLYSTTEYKKIRPTYFSPDVEEWERRFVKPS
jgi:DNA-binding Lrp family transcriptional regulator